MEYQLKSSLMDKTILMLHFGDNGIRGTEVCFIQSAKAFANSNYNVVICRNYPIMDPFLNQISNKPLLIDLQFPEVMIAGKNWISLPIISYFRSLKRLHNIVRKYKPSLIYCNAGLPCQLAVPIARLRKLPVLCHFHHPSVKWAYYFWLVIFANKIIFPSQFTKMHTKSKAGISGEVVYNGIDLNLFQAVENRDPQLRSSLGIADNAIVIGQVAQLLTYKRPELLIRALACLLPQCQQPIHLCLVGKGPIEASLRQLVSSLGLEAYVTITGYVEDVVPYYKHLFDINVLASTEEGLGISAIEGSACGLPIVVTRCTGLTETVIDGKNGFTFEMDNLIDLCEKLLLLINNPGLRKTMGAAGRANAERLFSSQAYGKSIVKIAEQMLGQ